MTPKALFKQGLEASLPALADFPSQLYWAYNTGRMFIADGSRVWQITNLVDRGTYNPLTTYFKNDLVRSGSPASTWKGLRTSTGVTPVEGADWTIFAAAGPASAISLLLDTQLTTDLWPGTTLTGGTWNNAIAGVSVTKASASSVIEVIATGMAYTSTISTSWASAITIAATGTRRYIGGGGFSSTTDSIISMSGTAIFTGLAAGPYQFLLQVQPSANANILLRASSQAPYEHARLVVLEVS